MAVSIAGAMVRRMFRVDPMAVHYWASGAYSIWTGGEDCAEWPRQRARESLESWYGVTDSGALMKLIGELRRAEQTGNHAWDAVRAVDLLRIGVAAGLVSEDACWHQVREIAAELRKDHSSWEDLAQKFEKGMNEWHDRRGVTDAGPRERVQRNLPALRQHIWPRVAFTARL